VAGCGSETEHAPEATPTDAGAGDAFRADGADAPESGSTDADASAAEDVQVVEDASGGDALEAGESDSARPTDGGHDGSDAEVDAQDADGSTADSAVVEAGSEAGVDAAQPEGGTPGKPTSIGPACDPAAAGQTVTFVHVNDLHAAYVRGQGGTSPFERIKGFEKQVRAAQPYTVFVNAGDDLEKGSVAELLSNGRASIEAAEAMQFTVRTIGNHDFAWNLQESLRFTRDPTALMVSSNLSYHGPDPSLFGASDYAELQVGCVRVGFFGLLSQPWNELDAPYQGNYYPQFTVRHDHAQVANEVIAQHRSNVDLLVLVSHLGYWRDLVLAGQAPGIDLIIGGHSHDALQAASKVGSTVVVQAGDSGRYVGKIELGFDLSQGATWTGYNYELLSTSELPVDPAVQVAVSGIVQQYAPEAYASLAWVQAYNEQVGVAQVMAAAARSVLGADAAVVDVDTVWRTWGPGPLTQQQLLDSFRVERQPPGTPGFNAFYLAQVSGSTLQALRDGLGNDWVYLGPSSSDAGQSYTLALQKRPAMHAQAYLPSGVSITGPVFAREAWEILDEYGRARTASCRYIDSDASLASCP
jgi:hypothetical protein